MQMYMRMCVSDAIRPQLNRAARKKGKQMLKTQTHTKARAPRALTEASLEDAIREKLRCVCVCVYVCVCVCVCVLSCDKHTHTHSLTHSLSLSLSHTLTHTGVENERRQSWLDRLYKRSGESHGALPLSYETVKTLHDDLLSLEV